ncbi:MAG: DUF6262 family protein [Candidatus Limnocylindria bacterium]
MTSLSHVEGMIAARRQDSSTKRARVLSTVQEMLAEHTPITFASVARQAEVSTWLVYAPGVREAIEQARARQRDQGATERRFPTDTSGLATDLALARTEITRLRAERQQHQQQLQRALGSKMDNIAKADLLARVDELSRHNAELAAAAAQQQSDNESLRARITELEDDLAAARTSLRRMIRAENSLPERS